MTKEINDPKLIHKLIDSLYKVIPVYMEVDGESIPVKILECKPESITIRSSKVSQNTDERILTIKNKENIFVITTSEVGTDDLGNSILKPIKTLIKDISSHSLTNDYTVSNIINHNDIFKSLGDERINQIVKKPPVVNSMFNFFEIFVNERMNSRMRLMNTHDKPIFIPEITNPDLVKQEFVPFKDYYVLTKNSNFLDKYKSEICIPIKYKNIVMIGYVHAMHSSRLDSNSYNTFKLISASIIKDIHSSGAFEESKENCPVIELNSTAIKFLHPPTRLASRMFSMGGTVIFDIISKSGQKKSVRGVVKGIKPTDKDYAINCDFAIHTPEESKSLEDFLAK